MNWAAITAIGTVLAGLALSLAFIQLGALRQDRLRAQVSKVGAWAEKPTLLDKRATFWFIPVFVRNSSELPVQIDAVDAAIRPWGYERTLAAPEGATEVEYYADKRFGAISEAHFAPGTIAPAGPGMWDTPTTRRSSSIVLNRLWFPLPGSSSPMLRVTSGKFVQRRPGLLSVSGGGAGGGGNAMDVYS